MSMVSIPVPADLEHVLKPVLERDPEKGAEWLRAGFEARLAETVSAVADTPYLNGAVCRIAGRQPVGTGRLITGTGVKGDQPARLIDRFTAAVVQACSTLVGRADEFFWL